MLYIFTASRMTSFSEGERRCCAFYTHLNIALRTSFTYHRNRAMYKKKGLCIRKLFIFSFDLLEIQSVYCVLSDIMSKITKHSFGLALDVTTRPSFPYVACGSVDY